jgi:hypothetical protein
VHVPASIASSEFESGSGATKSDLDLSQIPTKSGISLADPGTDRSRGVELEKCLKLWTQTIISSQQHNLAQESRVLEEIYLRLLDLEVRINQLSGLLESAIERNHWIQQREDVYGSFISARHEIEGLYKQDLKSNNPLRLEGRIGRSLRDRNLPYAEVLVVESPSNPENFVIELDIPEGNKDDIFVATAEVLANEILYSNLAVEHISLHYAGATIRWNAEQILKAAAALGDESGRRRCVAMMELSGIEHTLP